MALNNLGANSELLSWVVYLHDGKNSVNIWIDNNQSYNSLVIPSTFSLRVRWKELQDCQIAGTFLEL